MRRLYVYYCMLAMLLVALFASCSSTQKITVKQEQEGQVQETVIESDTKVNNFAIVISGDRIEYNGSIYRPQPKRERAQKMQAHVSENVKTVADSDLTRQATERYSPNTQYFRG